MSELWQLNTGKSGYHTYFPEAETTGYPTSFLLNLLDKRVEKIRKLIGAIRHPTSDLRDPTSDIRHSKSDIRHPRFDIRHPRFDIRHLTSEIRHPTFDIRHPTFDIRDLHRRTGRGGEGDCSPPPPKFWATQIFWAAREKLGKASF